MRTTLKITLLILVLIFSMTVAASAAEGNPLNGWNAAHNQYFQNGIALKGIQEIPGEGLYLFDSDGYAAQDYGKDKNGILYFFSIKEGKAQSGVIFSGENDKDGLYYKDGKPHTGLREINGKTICYKAGKKHTGEYKGIYYSEGEKYTGLVGDIYYQNGVKFKGITGGKYYENGKKHTGNREVDGKTYYYKDGVKHTGTVDGIYYKAGIKYTGVINGYYYKNGKKYTGTRKIDGKIYYYKNGKKHTGFRTINGKSYYYKYGRKYSGFNNSYYYKSGVKFVPEKAGAKKIGKYYYYVGSKGKVAFPDSKGLKKMSNARYYYIFKNGHVKRFDEKGIHKIDGKAYYYTGSFTVKNPGKAQFVKIKDKTYRFSKYGYLVTGWHTYDKKKYYMSKTQYYRFSDGVKTIDGDKYYFSKNGYVFKNKWYKKGGVKKYYFGKTGKQVKSGSAYIGKYKFYFDSKGKLQKDLIRYKGYDWILKHSLKVMVNRQTNTVTIYAKDGDKGYTIPVCVFLCTTGTADRPTDKGDYYTGEIYRWKKLGGRTEEQDNGEPCWGQYVTHIYGAVFFHSVCFEKKNNHTLFTSAYNWLGNKGSHGCVRLKCGDAYKMYKLASRQNMKVHIYDSSNPGAFGKPKLKKIYTSYDPTDPNV